MEQRGFILIADITGYTAYLNDSELEHAQGTLTELLELLIEHTKSPLVISRLEGDAVISYGLEAGFIGGQIVRQLHAADHEIVALVRTPSRATHLESLGVSLHQGDITDKASMRAGMSGVDGVFHVAAWYRLGARDNAAAERINVEGTRCVLELMQELQIPRGVYTSTLAIHSDTRGREVGEEHRFSGNHLTEYDRTKWMAHHKVALPAMEFRCQSDSCLVEELSPKWARVPGSRLSRRRGRCL